jgi:hypothetical protein
MSEAGIPNTASTAPPHGRSFVDRLLGVLRLDGSAYDDVAADPGALGQAAAVVLVAAACRAISARGGPFSEQGILFLVQLIAFWPVNTLLVFAIGRWFGHTPDLMRVARVMGFAMAPFALALLGLVPVEAVRFVVALLSTALLLATFVVGVRHALQTATGRAVFVSVVIALVLFFVSMVYNFLTAPR